MARPPVDALAVLIRLVDEGYDGKAWHGPTLRGALRRVSAAVAAWRPPGGGHTIWEIAVHAAYWKYAVRRRLRGEARGSFPLKGSNWFPRPAGDPSERAWKADLALLDAEHAALRAAVEDADPDELDSIPPGAKRTNAAVISGIAMHDVYHAGQVRLLKRQAAAIGEG